jgi:hypothetical protein
MTSHHFTGGTGVVVGGTDLGTQVKHDCTEGGLAPKAGNINVPKVVSKYTSVLIGLVLSERVTDPVLIESCEFVREFL